jgi:RNA polymerase-binding transcription factor DksA
MEQLEQEKKKLLFLKTNISKYLNDVNSKIENVQQNIYTHCKKTTGHKIIREREQGPYGEMFSYCELCGYEY